MSIPHPYVNSNWFTKFTFCWVNKVIGKDDWMERISKYEKLPDHCAADLHKKMDKILRKKDNTLRYSVMLGIMRFCLVDFLVSLLFKFIGDVLVISFAFLIRSLITDIQKTTNYLTYIKAGVIAPLNAISFVIQRYSVYRMEETVLFLVSLQCVLASRQGSMRYRIAKQTDKRVNTMNEVLSGMQAIKMLVWERHFISVIQTLRKKEIFKIFVSFMMRVFYKVIGLIMALEAPCFLMFPEALFFASECTASMKRVQIMLTELDHHGIGSEKKTEVLDEKDILSIQNLHTGWMNYGKKGKTENFLQNIEFQSGKKRLIGISGAVGSGKSTLLLAILGEINALRGKTSVTSSISYMPQESWLFHDTIRENILFGETYDEKRYREVLKACSLQKDIEAQAFGDLTLVGEKGFMLSGGQKARISLARAIYRKADLYLLDDPLSAVDRHVAKELMEECVLGFLKDKYVILVSHQVDCLKQVDILYEMSNGKLKEINRESVKSNDDEEKHVKDVELSSTENFIVEESREQGFSGLKTYIKILSHYLGKTWDDTITKLYPLFTIVCLIIVLDFARQATFFINVALCSVNFHNRMFKKIMTVPLRFFHTNPKGRILNRFARDLGFVDTLLGPLLDDCVTWFGATLFAIGLAISSVYLLSIPFLAILGCMIFIFLKITPYISQLKRLEAIERSPIFDHVDNTIHGLVSIRTFKRQKDFMKKFYEFSDTHTKVAFLLLNLYRFIQLAYGSLLVLFLFFATLACAYFAKYIHPAIAALALTYLNMFITPTQFAFRVLSDLESAMTSVERISEYTKLQSEDSIQKKKCIIPPHWPTSGGLVFNNLSYKYEESLPYVLHSVDLKIKSSQKIGIVGRTGAGKSSILSALFQLAQPEGEILFDHVNILKDVPLRKARSAISAIPQDPFLFSGSFRENLDPFEEYTDEEIWMSLNKVQMSDKLLSKYDQLESKVAEFGKNLSVGEKQLICLARALLKKSYVIVIDEGTANIDNHTDAVIQTVLRENFSECTMLVIAHRLNTIMDCDKIAVLDSGKVVEFGSASELLSKKGAFYDLVNVGLNK
ncbi:DgyrCDS12463 [Dimorphilus gyrociliatus]|uniref:DgyrCDS12463 n=1 Tax=Dimorphilus gyrociliatus TaxID=2664684 RepID=A0A7I8W8K7_9ANNE|nr:DgyrCDS12463 [Dimorphilus gyrociliatus]